MSFIEKISGEIYSIKESGDPKTVQKFLDPVTMAIIINVVTMLIKQLVKCIEERKADEEAKIGSEIPVEKFQDRQYTMQMLKEPNRREKNMVKKALRDKMGWIKYRREGQQYYEAILERRNHLTDDDIREIRMTNMLQRYGDDEK